MIKTRAFLSFRYHALQALGLSAALCLSQNVFAANAPYISSKLRIFDSLLAPPPIPGSAEGKADLQETIEVARHATADQIRLGESEQQVYLNYFASIVPALADTNLSATRTLSTNLDATIHEVVEREKNYWKRARPYTLEPGLAAGKLETSFSYPSGHSTRAMVFGLVLADLVPEKKEAIIELARGIGWHRVVRGRHFPTDIYAGRVLAQAIVREMKLNPRFQRDFDAVKEEWSVQGRPRSP